MKKPILTVETDIQKRWEDEIPHNPKSIELYRAISNIDRKYGNDHFEFKSGGDGDNGEHLMYLLDIYYDQQEEWKARHAPARKKKSKYRNK